MNFLIRFSLILTVSILPLSMATTSQYGSKYSSKIDLYPAGIILGVDKNYFFGKNIYAFGLAANLTDRHDWAEHEDEKGGGVGLHFSASRVFSKNLNWLWGSQFHLWHMWISWQDTAASGNTESIVIQPSIFIGYRATKNLFINLSFGAELNINLNDQDDDVGEGPIGMLGAKYYF